MEKEDIRKMYDDYKSFCNRTICDECKYEERICEFEYVIEKIENVKRNEKEVETFELIGSVDLNLNNSNVNSPSHYNAGNLEVIDAIEDWELNFNLGNAIKYIARCEHKNNKVEDLKKAIWYINREIEKECK